MPFSLLEACEKGNSNQVKSLIDGKYNINELDAQGRSALHYCSNNKTTDCASLLLRDNSIKNTILNLQDNEGCTALHLACINGNEVMVRYLCEQGANVALLDHESRSLIHWITVCGHVHLFDILIEYKVPIHTPDIHGVFPIHYASQLSGMSDNNGSKIDSAKALAILQKIIDRKVDIDCTDGRQRTPLMWAASAGAIDQLRLLYKYGADQLHVDKDSLTALHCAASHGHIPCIQMLVHHCRCPLEGEDINGCTALFYAVMFNHVNACRLLLELQANSNHKDKRGRTPSHYAISKGHLDCLKLLIKFNANIWIKNKHGDYPINEAINNLSVNKGRNQTNECSQILAVIRYIFQIYPTKVQIRNDQQQTPLHLAASRGDIDTCKVLIECGAITNAFIKTLAGDYITPYDLARSGHQHECAQYLLYKHGGQRGNLLANIFARRIQKQYRQYKHRKATLLNQLEKLNSITTEESSTKRKDSSSISSKSHLVKQAISYSDNKSSDIRGKRYSVNSLSLTTGTSIENDQDLLERRHIFAKSKLTLTSNDQNDESKVDTANKIIIQSSNSVSTYNKLYDRRKIIEEELHKLRQARIHNHYIVINRSLYKILIENGYNPQHRCAEDIEKYLETLITTYSTELEAIRKRTQSVPAKQNRRTSLMF